MSTRCGEGVFLSNTAGGMEPRPSWRAGIDALCAAVARATGTGAEVRYTSYPAARDVQPGAARRLQLDVTGPEGSVVMSVSIAPRGDAEHIDARDLPSIPFGAIGPGAELEFWLANEFDALCLAAHLLEAIDHSRVSVCSSVGPSTRAR